MTWTYAQDFTNYQRDRIRFEVGDTTSSDQLLSDEEIAYAATVEGSDQAVAARCCEAIAKKFARKADMTEGHLSIKLSQRSQAYRNMAKDLRERESLGAVPFAGGISISDYDSRNEDTDRVAPAFYRGMLDNSEAQQNTPGSADDESAAADLDD